MPIYTYRCKNCGVQFDIQQKFSDPALTRCPECNKKMLYKVFQPVGIVFKGSGFYATDHRSPSGASRGSGNSKSSEENSGGAKNAEEKSESKTESNTSSSESKSTERAKSEKE